MRTPAAILLLGLLAAAHGQTVTFDLYAGMNGQVTLDDGHVTNFWGYGYLGQPMTLPAPALVVTTGDTVDVKMRNLSPEAHTIHLHGLDVDQVNDGVPQTSFYVFIGDSATYSFVSKYPGNYIYHCHVTTMLHLTMGMYGLVVVREPGDVLYAGGPSYDREQDYLFSDLEVRVNDAPLMAFPFHEIRPDHFMVNGLAGQQLLDDTTLHVQAEAGEAVALRLANIAYSIVRCVFPPGANAIVHLSDGRVLPQAFPTDTLELYPGERFTVLLEPRVDLSGTLQVEYYSMLSGALVGSNAIPVGVTERTAGSGPPWSVAPNPAHGTLVLTVQDRGGRLRWTAPDGRLVREDRVVNGPNRLDVSGMSPGVYLLHDASGRATRVVIERP